MEKNFCLEESEGCPGGEKAGNGPYCEAPEVKLIADELIKKHHPHLEGVSICYLFKSGRWSNRDKPVKGKTMIAPPLWQHVSGSELIVIINQHLFNSMNEKGRMVMVDNEISSFEPPVEKQCGRKHWRFREHDICEYSDVLARHNICVSNLIPVIKGELVQLDIMQTLSETVENVEEITAVYPAIEVEDAEIYVCDDYEELIKDDPRYDGLR